MDGILQPLINQINTTEDNILQYVKDIITENKTEILKIFKENQLFKGLRSDGKVAGVYKPSTELWAAKYPPIKPKKAFQPYNFQWTGALSDNLDIRNASGSEYIIFSRSGTQKILEDTYGRIFDLTEENNEWINENIIAPALYEKILSEIFESFI